MGIFVSYKSNVFSDLTSKPQTIIGTTTNTIWVQHIHITNKGVEPIRINLQFNRVLDGKTISNFLTYNYPIPSWRELDASDKGKNTKDLVEELGLELNLEYDNNLSDSLICYSNGPAGTQKFDCTVTYALLNELPANIE